jgi:hypothetical protein
VEQQRHETFIVQLLMDQRGAVHRTRVVDVMIQSEERWAGWEEERLLRFVVLHGGFSPPE